MTTQPHINQGATYMIYNKLTKELDELIRSYIAVDELMTTLAEEGVDTISEEQHKHIRGQVELFQSLLPKP